MIKNAYEIFLTTLANMNRLKILNELKDKSLNVSELSSKTSLNQTTVSHNLNRLKVCGFVHVEQKGRHRYYSVNKETIKPLMNLIDRHIRKNCSKLKISEERK